MSGSLDQILARRQVLLERSQAQRAELEAIVDRIAPAFALADRGAAIVRYLKAHPVLVGAGVAVVTALRTRSVIKVAARGIGIWRSVRWLQRVTRGLRA